MEKKILSRRVSTKLSGRIAVYTCFVLAVAILLLKLWPFSLKKLGHGVKDERCTPTRVGGNPENDWYGSWWLCEEQLQTGQALISFGSGCDSTFEWDYLSFNPTAACHILDPTISLDRFWSCSNTSRGIVSRQKEIHQLMQPQFWPIGLSNERKLARFSKSNNPQIESLTEVDMKGYSQTSFHGLLFDLQITFEFLKIQSRPILKMDIEGSEFDVIMSWCNEKMPKNMPSQLLIEFHLRFFSNGQEKFEQAIECLKLLGYQKSFDNNGEEFLFYLTH